MNTPSHHALTLLTIFLTTLLHAQEPTTPAPSLKKESAIQQIDENNYRIGKIHLNKKSRTITLPATVNILDGPLEYVLVLEKGQNHESLFTTDILPFNLNLALKLLNYQASLELFRILDQNYRPTAEFHQVTPEVQAAARANLFVAITQPDNKAPKELPLNGLILLAATGTPVPERPWVYNGSYIHKGKFKADLRGNVIALLEDSSALFNGPFDNRDGDRLWTANAKHLPPFGTPVTIIIKPAPKQ